MVRFCLLRAVLGQQNYLSVFHPTVFTQTNSFRGTCLASLARLPGNCCRVEHSKQGLASRNFRCLFWKSDRQAASRKRVASTLCILRCD